MKSIYTKSIFLVFLIFLTSIFLLSSKTSAAEGDDIDPAELVQPDILRLLETNRKIEAGERIEGPEIEGPEKPTEDNLEASLPRNSLQIRTITDILNLEGVLITPENAKAQGYAILNSFFDFLIKLIAFLSVISIAFIGFKLVYSASVGNVGEYTKTKQELRNIIVAIIIMLTAWLFLNTLNSDLLNLPSGTQISSSPSRDLSDTPPIARDSSLKNVGKGVAEERNARNCVFYNKDIVNFINQVLPAVEAATGKDTIITGGDRYKVGTTILSSSNGKPISNSAAESKHLIGEAFDFKILFGNIQPQEKTRLINKAIQAINGLGLTPTPRVLLGSSSGKRYRDEHIHVDFPGLSRRSQIPNKKTIESNLKTGSC